MWTQADTMLPGPLCLALGLCVLGSTAIQWNPPSSEDRTQVYTCPGSDVVLSWDYTLNDTEILVDIKWFRQTVGKAPEIIASLAGGHFFTDDANVQHVPPAGLRVAQAQVGDVYSVTIDVASASGLSSYTRSATVRSAVPPVTEQGHLQAEVQPGAVVDGRTGRWGIQLGCGHFTSLGQPAVTVHWKTPSGQILNSSSFQNGSFVLNLYDPVETGTYFCVMFNATDTASCQELQALQEVPLTVTRLVVLEAENREMKEQVHGMMEYLHMYHLDMQSLQGNESEAASRLRDCLMATTTTARPKTTITTIPAPIAKTTVPAITAALAPLLCSTAKREPKTTTTHVPCVDKVSYCSQVVRMWQCRDPGQGSLARTMCRRYCGFC